MEHSHQIGAMLSRAWQEKNLTLLRGHLADRLEWYEHPYGEPLTTPGDVIAQWERDLAGQSNIDVVVTLLDALDNRNYYHCRALWYKPDGTVREIDGVFVVCLTPEGKIAYFMQWWSPKP